MGRRRSAGPFFHFARNSLVTCPDGEIECAAILFSRLRPVRWRMKSWIALGCLTLVLAACSVAGGQTGSVVSSRATARGSLDSEVKAQLASFKGIVSLFARNIDTGETYALGADDRVRTASTIKIAVMVEAFARVADGKAKWTDELVLTKAARFSGSGVLQELSDGLRLTLRDCVNLMMLVSDNTATNMVLDYLTTDAVNARMASLGLKQIRILRRVGSGGESKEGKDPDNKRFGLGVATPREMVTLMEKLERGE